MRGMRVHPNIAQDCCTKIYARQGVRGFYGGLAANTVRALPEASIQYACYETIKAFIHDMCAM